MRARVGLVVAALLVALVIGELALRVAWDNPYAGSSPDTILKIQVHPGNVDQRIDRSQVDPQDSRVLYRTNDRGYILPVERFESPDITILFLGGSTTACVAVKEDQRFPFLVSRHLERDGIRANILNAARSGGTLHDSINVLLNHAAEDSPDVVVVMHAVNDHGVLSRDGSYASRMGHTMTAPDVLRYVMQRASSRLALAGLARRAATFEEFEIQSGARYRDDLVDPGPFRARLRMVVGITRALGARPVLMTQPLSMVGANELTPRWVAPNTHQLFNDVTREVAGETGAVLIDLASLVSEGALGEDELRRIFYDGMHVNDYGSSVYAAYIAEHLGRALGAER